MFVCLCVCMFVRVDTSAAINRVIVTDTDIDTLRSLDCQGKNTHLLVADCQPHDHPVHCAPEKRFIEPVLHLVPPDLDRFRLLIRCRLRVALKIVLPPVHLLVGVVDLFLRSLRTLLRSLRSLLFAFLLFVVIDFPLRCGLSRLTPLLRGKLLQRSSLGVLRSLLRRRLFPIGKRGGLLLELLLLSQQLGPLSLLLEPLLLQGHLHLALELGHVCQALALLLAEHVVRLLIVIVARKRELRQNLWYKIDASR